MHRGVGGGERHWADRANLQLEEHPFERPSTTLSGIGQGRAVIGKDKIAVCRMGR